MVLLISGLRQTSPVVAPASRSHKRIWAQVNSDNIVGRNRWKIDIAMKMSGNFYSVEILAPMAIVATHFLIGPTGLSAASLSRTMAFLACY